VAPSFYRTENGSRLMQINELKMIDVAQWISMYGRDRCNPRVPAHLGNSELTSYFLKARATRPDKELTMIEQRSLRCLEAKFCSSF
jgi:hypothetical protein